MTRAAFWNILQRNDEAVSSMIGGDFHSASTMLRDCFVMIREDLIRLASPSTNRNSNVDRGHDDRRRGAGGVRTNITHHHDHQDHASLSSFAQLITPTAQAMVAGESSSTTTHLQQQEADSTNTVIVGDFFVYSRPLCFLGGGAAAARYYTGGTTRMTCSCADDDDPSPAGLLDGQVISMTIIFNMALLYHQRFLLLGDTSALTKCQKLYLHVLQLTQIMEEEEHQEGAEPEDEGTFVVSAARRRFSWEIGFLATNNYFHCSRAIGDHEAALRSALHLQSFAHEASSSSSGMTTSSSASSSSLASPPSTTASIPGGSRPWGGALSYQHQQNEIHRQQRGEEYHHLLLISPNELNELLINTVTLQSSIVHDDDDDEQRTGERHHQQERFFLLLPHAPAA